MGGCNLACRSCETADFSLERKGVVSFTEAQLATLFLKQQNDGAANLNLVTPTHVMPALLSGLAAAAERGFVIPVVWNCGGYESLAALELLDGIVDVYLPDAKYGRDAEGESVSGSPGYTKALRESLREMWRQTGPIEIDARGLATRGTIVRHLVLPNDAAGSREAMQLCAEVSLDLWVNVMSQYRPLHNAKRLPVISRRCSKAEIEFAVQAALDAGLRNVLLDGKRVMGEEMLGSRKAAKAQSLG
jgi:putative pyruvate formate lyase activating enzyme